jgi:tetratricopeptide (TPR) repeat protein
MAGGIATIAAGRLARVCFTGRLLSISRGRAEEIVRARGGVVVGSVSRRATLLVVGMGGWPVGTDGLVSRKLARAEQLQAEGAAIEIVSESAFVELLGLEAAQSRLDKSYTLDRVCEIIGIEPAVLRRWEVQGLVRSHDGAYDFQDLVSLRTITSLIHRNVKPHTIARSVRELSSILPDTERPLAQLKLVAESGAILAELGDTLLSPDGQLFINFETKPGGADEAAAVIPLTPPPARDARSAEAWFEHAQMCEEEDLLDESIAAYRRALALRPRFPEAHFNLGNVLRALDRLGAAEEHFLMALYQEPSLAVAWYNLADVQEAMGRQDDAIESLRESLRLLPDYADAHYNLAAFLEDADRHDEAREHWRAYLRLDRDSPWAEVAMHHLGGRPGEELGI